MPRGAGAGVPDGAVGWAESGARRAPNPWMIMSRTRVVVADDDLLLREGIARLLKGSQFELSGLAGDASELMQLVRRIEPDLVVLDIRMPPSYSTEGLEAAHAIRGQFPG